MDKDFPSEKLQDFLQELEIRVEKIDLMESKQIKGELIHKVIYYKNL